MNYEESNLILEKIKKSQTFLLNCHESADVDSVASSLSLARVLKNMGKKVTVGSPDEVSRAYDFLEGFEEIKKMDFQNLNFSKFDTFFILDSEHWGRVGREDSPKNTFVVNIDHHIHNRVSGDLNLLDFKASSTCEMLYLLFRDWNIKIDKELATLLLAGIFSDTGYFQFASTTGKACKIAGGLIDTGADFNHIVLNLSRRNSLDIIRLWGEVASRVEVDKKHKFAWSALPYEVYKRYKVSISPTSNVTDRLLRTIEGTNFAIGMVEKEKDKKLHISFRARITGFDVSGMAKELGGGGHKDAAGGSVEGLPFEKAVKKVLQVARKYAEKNAI